MKRCNRTALDYMPAICVIGLAIWSLAFMIWAHVTDWHWSNHKRPSATDFQGGILSQEDFDYFKRHGVVLSVDAMEKSE